MSNFGKKVKHYNLFYSIAIDLYSLYSSIRHFFGKMIKKYYFEDFVRVYPDKLSFNQIGIRKKYTKQDEINFINHAKVYHFTSQFVKNKVVADIGCGSGYGCEILKKAGAKKVYGCDASRQSMSFASKRYPGIAEFTVQDITNLKLYKNDSFDIVICSEVLEHIKEYQKEEKALDELIRITNKEGLIVIATPNTEIIPDHGFSFNEINQLFKSKFSQYSIFENVLVPTKDFMNLWSDRKKKKNVGIIIPENINLRQISLLDGVNASIKAGIKPGDYKLGKYVINTKLLYNPISWVVVAIKK